MIKKKRKGKQLIDKTRLIQIRCLKADFQTFLDFLGRHTSDFLLPLTPESKLQTTQIFYHFTPNNQSCGGRNKRIAGWYRPFFVSNY